MDLDQRFINNLSWLGPHPISPPAKAIIDISSTWGTWGTRLRLILHHWDDAVHLRTDLK
jgi:hypothetical protein